MRGRQNDKPAQSKPQDKPLRSFVFKHNLGAYQNWIFIAALLAEDKVSCSHEEYLQIGLDGFDWWSVSMCICVSALSICVTFPWTAVWGEDTYLSTDSPRPTFHTWSHPLITNHWVHQIQFVSVSAVDFAVALWPLSNCLQVHTAAHMFCIIIVVNVSALAGW